MNHKLAIIGGGPAGLATARVFLANSPDVDEIHIFTNDDHVGGVWYLPGDHRSHRVMYEYLETNLPKEIMQFSGVPFSESVPMFPQRTDVFWYLQEYYCKFIEASTRVKIHWNCEVTHVEKQADTGHWILTVGDSLQEAATCNTFEMLVVANGHFNVPFIPTDVPGLQRWFDAGQAIHSRDFQNCEFAAGKNVIVVGNGSSGQDIVNQLSSVAKNVYHSIRDETSITRDVCPETNCNIYHVPVISQVNLEYKTVTLGNGKSLENIDWLVYATGFQYDMRLLPESIRSQIMAQPEEVDSGLCKTVTNLWGHIFLKSDPTIAFALLPQGVVPFPTAELQATLMVEVFSQRVKVSPHSKGPFDDDLQFPCGMDVDYYNWLQECIDQASLAGSPTTGDTLNGAPRFQPVIWDQHHRELRLSCPELKRQRNVKLHHRSQTLRTARKPYTL